jgi:hypothetical protein
MGGVIDGPHAVTRSAMNGHHQVDNAWWQSTDSTITLGYRIIPDKVAFSELPTILSIPPKKLIGVVRPPVVAVKQ